ncbi:hypothetical protein ABFX02_01G000200 [Erythranthe guttata]
MNVLGKSIRPTFEELQIDENAKKSDVVQLQVVEKLADNDILGVYYDYLKQKDINASELLKSRHMEIDYLQSIVTKAENALSIDGIKNQICDLENKIKHDVLALEVRKKLKREISRLSQRREKLSSSSFFDIKDEDGIRQYREVRDEAEDFLKVVSRKELDIFNESSIKAKAAVTEFKKKCDDAAEQVEKLQANYIAASDENAKKSDVVQLQVVEKLADNDILGVYYDYLKQKDINASELLKSRHMEIDYLQSIVTKAGNALSIDGIKNQICDLENKIKHDVLALEVRKKLKREISRLSQRREKLSSSSFFDIKDEDGIRQYREVRDEAEDFLKVVSRKELDIFNESSIKAKAAVTEFKKKYDDAAEQVEKLQANYIAASDVCIEAIAIKDNMKKKIL